jgi:hypothetical protein
MRLTVLIGASLIASFVTEFTPATAAADRSARKSEQTRPTTSPRPKAIPRSKQTGPRSASANRRSGAWSLSTNTDRMTDVVRGIAIARNEDLQLFVTCGGTGGDNSVVFSFISANFLGEGRWDGYRQISYRIDGAPLQQVGAYHDRMSALVIDSNRESAGWGFLKQVTSASNLTVQLADYEGRRYTTVLSVSGASDALRFVSNICRDTAFSTFLNE